MRNEVINLTDTTFAERLELKKFLECRQEPIYHDTCAFKYKLMNNAHTRFFYSEGFWFSPSSALARYKEKVITISLSAFMRKYRDNAMSLQEIYDA